MFARFRTPRIMLSSRQRTLLTALQRGTHVPQHLKRRATMILEASAGASNAEIARQTGATRSTVKHWRQKWATAASILADVETSRPWKLRATLRQTLEDAQRSGTPSRITNAQIAEIVAMACESPEKYDVPLTRWTAEALARTAIQRQIVTRLSARQVGRYLANAELKPHRSKYWLNPDVDDPEAFKAEVVALCDLYADAPRLTEGLASKCMSRRIRRCRCGPVNRKPSSLNTNATARPA